MANKQIVTVTFFRYAGLRECWWAFRQMGLAGEVLAGVEGLEFAKMLGSGSGNGFSLRPNFGVYGLLGVWSREADARRFVGSHPLFGDFRQHAREWWTVFMQTARVHGQWGGSTPFTVATTFDADRPVGVLTRATIRPEHLWRFWRFVPGVSRSIESQEGLLFSVGIGELPVVQQATFSLWTNSHHMQAYAYHGRHHREVIRRTRELGWYREELFARFHPFRCEGSWQGRNPLKGMLPESDYLRGDNTPTHGPQL